MDLRTHPNLVGYDILIGVQDEPILSDRNVFIGPKGSLTGANVDMSSVQRIVVTVDEIKAELREWKYGDVGDMVRAPE